MIGAGMLVRSIDYEESPFPKHVAWMLHAGILASLGPPLRHSLDPLMPLGGGSPAGALLGFALWFFKNRRLWLKEGLRALGQQPWKGRGGLEPWHPAVFKGRHSRPLNCSWGRAACLGRLAAEFITSASSPARPRGAWRTRCRRECERRGQLKAGGASAGFGSHTSPVPRGAFPSLPCRSRLSPKGFFSLSPRSFFSSPPSTQNPRSFLEEKRNAFKGKRKKARLPLEEREKSPLFHLTVFFSCFLFYFLLLPLPPRGLSLRPGVMGAVVAPLTLLGGPLLIRAAWYTAGIVGGLSAVAMCAPSEKFLNMGAPLGLGLGLVLVSSVGSMFLPPTSVLGAGMYSVAIYGGLVLFSLFLLHDTQHVIRRAESQPYLVVGVRKYDPINACMGIYMDTLNIFIRVATMLASGGGRKK
uniref:Growth hormone inducible transmembrane protein n=1 Tax=Laticauda laticaudata TaxID=8630 RepID=A0A8C5RPT0_LATLA